MAGNRKMLNFVVVLSALVCASLEKAEGIPKRSIFRRFKSKARMGGLQGDLHENSLLSDSTNKKPVRFEAFSWTSCAGPDAMLDLTKLQISDPISVPGNLTISASAELKYDVVAPLKVSVHVQKKIGFIWVEVPCVENIGSCNYDDFCTIIPFKPDDPCPPFFATSGLPCHCPASKGKYAVENGTLLIPKEPLPEFLARGQYAVRVNIASQAKEVTCLKLAFSLA